MPKPRSIDNIRQWLIQIHIFTFISKILQYYHASAVMMCKMLWLHHRLAITLFSMLFFFAAGMIGIFQGDPYVDSCSSEWRIWANGQSCF